MAPPGGHAHPTGLLCFFHTLVLSVSNGWEKEKDLCVLRISGERWETSVLSGLRSMPVWKKKKNKVLHALDFVSINLLFRGKTQVLRKTTFVTVCSWNSLSNPKRLYHFDSRSPLFFPAGGRKKSGENSPFWGFLIVFVARRPGRQSDVEIWRRQSTSSLPTADSPARPSLFTTRRPTLLCFSRGAPGRLSSGSCSRASAAAGEEQPNRLLVPFCSRFGVLKEDLC